MDSPIRCQREWVLRGGHLRAPIVLEVEESYGEAWWRINSGNKGLSDFLSKDYYSRRPLSNTNLFEVLKQARDDATLLSTAPRALPQLIEMRRRPLCMERLPWRPSPKGASSQRWSSRQS